MSSLNRRVATLALGYALVLPLLPTAASAADTWSPPQTLASAPATNPSTALAETADGTLVAITLGADGTFRRSSRAPGEDWVPSGVFADPDGLALEFVNAVAVTRDGAGWLAYTVEDAEAGDVRVVRWAPDGGSEVVGVIVDAWTTVDLTVDAEGDVLAAYGLRGGYPLSALYGDADGLDPLGVPDWTGTHRPHQWVLGPDDAVMLASRFGAELRTVDLRPDGSGKTRTLDRPGAGLADQVAAAIAPSGTRYLAWTTAPEGGPRAVYVARRAAGGGWLPGRIVDIRGARSRLQQSLAIRPTAGGAYLAWVQPGGDGSEIRGALARRQRPVLTQTVAGPRAVGDLVGHAWALDVGRRGRLLVAWTTDRDRGRGVVAALGRVRGEPVVTRLFGVDADEAPVALLRATGAATVAGSSPSTADTGPVVRAASTD